MASAVMLRPNRKRAQTTATASEFALRLGALRDGAAAACMKAGWQPGFATVSPVVLATRQSRSDMVGTGQPKTSTGFRDRLNVAESPLK